VTGRAAPQTAVLVVDDSPSVRRKVRQMIDAEPGLVVVALLASGDRVVETIRSLRPDVVTLDVQMPGIDGLQVLDAIMRDVPTPVVMLSAATTAGSVAAIRALAAGAVDFVPKPVASGTTLNAFREQLLRTIRIAARVKPIRQYESALAAGAQRPSSAEPASRITRGCVVIAASTGGPAALSTLLGQLPGDFPFAILIVQHLPAVHTAMLGRELNRRSAVQVREATDGDHLTRGVALIAPGGWHTQVSPAGRISLLDTAHRPGHSPSADIAMSGVAHAFGASSIGVVLTGMGIDGCEGATMVKAGGGIVLVQDEATSAVWGMPGAVVRVGAADEVMPLRAIASRVTDLALSRAA
jgi:two-component system, chemotaxis family, protein-glutamate methylesterase/glutaminase